MCFYEALQLDPAVLKNHIRTASGKEKLWFIKALIVRDILLVGFSILFISALTAIFGNENSSMAVVIFCILLSTRFVSFGYKISHSLFNFAVVFALLFISPVLIGNTGAFVGFLINFISIAVITAITCENPEMGNGGLYVFGYIFLSGNPVSGEALANRGLMAAAGYAMCAAVMFFKHKHKHNEVSFIHVVGKFSIYDPKCQWQIQLALGISLLYLVNSIVDLDRFMWAGFACSSLLASYPSNINGRMCDRAAGVVIGSVMFGIVYHFIPEWILPFLGPAAGLCLGVCSDYKYKTVFNCFGALLLASSVYGVKGAAAIRVIDNMLGILFAFLFFTAYRKIFIEKLLKCGKEECVSYI